MPVILWEFMATSAVGCGTRFKAGMNPAANTPEPLALGIILAEDVADTSSLKTQLSANSLIAVPTRVAVLAPAAVSSRTVVASVCAVDRWVILVYPKLA